MIENLSKTKAESYLHGIIDPLTKGVFRDEHWAPIHQIQKKLAEGNVEAVLTHAGYTHEPGKQMPKGKEWDFDIFQGDKGGWHLKILASFGPSSVDQKTQEHKSDAYDVIYTLNWDGRMKKSASVIQEITRLEQKIKKSYQGTKKRITRYEHDNHSIEIFKEDAGGVSVTVDKKEVPGTFPDSVKAYDAAVEWLEHQGHHKAAFYFKLAALERKIALNKATVRAFLTILAGSLTRYDEKLQKKEPNIYRLGHLLKAKQEVEEKVKKYLDDDSPEAMQALKAALQEHFYVDSMPPTRNLMKQIDAWLQEKKLPKYAAETGPRGGKIIGYTKKDEPIYEKHLHDALKAHNAGKEEPSFNESYNEAHGLGDRLHRGLVSQAASSVHGIGGGHKKVTMEDVAHHIMGNHKLHPDVKVQTGPEKGKAKFVHKEASDDFIEDGDKAEAVADDIWQTAQTVMMEKVGKIVVEEAKAIAKRHGVTPETQYRDHTHGVKTIQYALALHTADFMSKGKYRS